MRRLVLWVPLAVFVLFVATVGIGLYSPAERTIRSQMVGKQIPHFALPEAVPGKPALTSDALTSGEPRLLNVFASW